MLHPPRSTLPHSRFSLVRCALGFSLGLALFGAASYQASAGQVIYEDFQSSDDARYTFFGVSNLGECKPGMAVERAGTQIKCIGAGSPLSFKTSYSTEAKLLYLGSTPDLAPHGEGPWVYLIKTMKVTSVPNSISGSVKSVLWGYRMDLDLGTPEHGSQTINWNSPEPKAMWPNSPSWEPLNLTLTNPGVQSPVPQAFPEAPVIIAIEVLP